MELLPIDQAFDLRADFDIFLYGKKPDPELLKTGTYPPLPVLRVTDGPTAGQVGPVPQTGPKPGMEAEAKTGKADQATEAGPSGGPILIWGWELLRVAKTSGIDEVKTQSFSFSAEEALELALRLEDRKDTYSWRECEAIWRLMKRWNIKGQDLENTGGLLSLVSSQSSLRKKLRQFSSLGPSLKELVEDASLSLKNAIKVSALPDEVSRVLRSKGENLTVSGKRIFLQYIQEIGKRDNISESEIVSTAKELLADNDPLKTLRRLRFPKLSSMEAAAEEFRKKYVKGTGITLEIPRNFEGDELIVNFHCRSREEFEKKRRQLEKLELHIDELFTILR